MVWTELGQLHLLPDDFPIGLASLFFILPSPFFYSKIAGLYAYKHAHDIRIGYFDKCRLMWLGCLDGGVARNEASKFYLQVNIGRSMDSRWRRRVIICSGLTGNVVDQCDKNGMYYTQFS